MEISNSYYFTVSKSKDYCMDKFSSTMASAIICLATNQKFNFSKWIFDSMIRNLDSVPSKFVMYPRFLQIFLDQQLDVVPTHKRKFSALSHTKKIFGNMRRIGKDFSGRVTPLFPTMVVQNQSELDEDKAVHKELGDSLVRASTTASSLEVEQDSGGGPRCQETIRDTIAQTRFERVSKQSNDSLLARGNTLRSDEDRMQLHELTDLCTNLQQMVLDLEKTKTTQHNEINSLKRRVNKLEKKNRSRTHKLKRLYKVGLTAKVESFGDEENLGEDASKQERRINAIDADDDITLVNDEVQNVVEEVVEVINTAKLIIDAAQVIVADDIVSTASATTTTAITTEEITLAQALEALKT
ncbi:hypothetical protein Tco_0698648 [Tanacetum coccineum]